jgi:hypothetical protein
MKGKPLHGNDIFEHYKKEDWNIGRGWTAAIWPHFSGRRGGYKMTPRPPVSESAFFAQASGQSLAIGA